MKYDLKKMLKLLIWLYPFALVLAGITRLLSIWNDIQAIKIVGMVFAGFTYAVVANIIVNTFVHILLRFSNSFYKDESYLTHTLPVKKNTLLLSKYLSSLIVILASVLCSFLSLFIIFYSHEFMQNLKMALDGVVSGFSMSSGLFVFLIILIIFSQICAMMSMAFSAIVKGYSYNHRRGIKGLLWFLAYYCACLITIIILAVIVTAITGDISTLFSNQMSSGAFLSVMIVALVSYIGVAILFYFVCRKEFNKGVNVD